MTGPVFAQVWIKALWRAAGGPTWSKAPEQARLLDRLINHASELYPELIETVTWYASGTNTPAQIAAWGPWTPLGTAATIRGKDGRRGDDVALARRGGFSDLTQHVRVARRPR